jgi:hypothetical protein
MANPRIMWTLTGVFLAGVGSGMLAMNYGIHDLIHRPKSVETASNTPQAPNEKEVLERFRKELNLTPEQTEKLAVILTDYQHYYQSVQEQIEQLRLRDQIDDLRATGKNRILEILDDNQRKKFEKMTNATLDPAATAKSQ